MAIPAQSPLLNPPLELPRRGGPRILVHGDETLAERLSELGAAAVAAGEEREPPEDGFEVEVLAASMLGSVPATTVEGAVESSGGRPIVVIAQGDEEDRLELLSAGAAEVLPASDARDARAVLSAARRALARRGPGAAPPPSSFKALIRSSWELVTVVDADGLVAYHSPSVESLLGLRAADRVGRSVFERIHPEDRDRVADALRQLVGVPDSTLVVRCRLRHADGEWRNLEVRATNLLEHPGVRGIVLNSWDATASTRVETALRNQEVRFRTVTECLGEGVLLADLEGRIVYANPSIRDITGYAAEELLGRPVSTLAGDQAELDAQARRLERRAMGISDSYETLLLRRDGSRRWVEVRASPFRDGDGEVVGALAVLVDVDDRRRQEERLRLLDSAVEGAWDAVCITDADLDKGASIVYVNPAFERITGFSSAEALGRGPSALLGLGRHDGTELARLLDCLRRGDVFSGDLLGQAADGRRLVMQWQVAPLQGRDVAPSHFVAIVRDVTEQRKIEERLRQSQKMEAVGRLAGGVAHDFNNLLTAIIGYNELILAQLAPGDPGRREAEQIARAVESSVSLTSRLLAFSRRDVLDPQPLDLAAVVRDVAEMLRRLVGEQIELAFSLPSELPLARADAGQVQQVLLNLTINARDAIAERGRVEIVTEAVELGPSGRGDLGPGCYVALRVRDNGCGMSDEVKARALEPFFTTKEAGRGTGLGLAMVYGIARHDGGDVWIDSEPGKGTAISVVFPLAPAVVPREEPPIEELDRPGRGESVLLAEDDEGVRVLCARLLQREGYRVLTAVDGAQAVAVAAAAAPIDLLVTDVVMPDLRGSALARRLTALYPGLRVLYISGYAEGELSQVEGGPTVGFLPKPFRPHDLVRKVREILAGAGAADAPPRR